jgi:hypothetical protein
MTFRRLVDMLQIPFIWQTWLPKSQADHARAQANYEKQNRTYEAAKEKAASEGRDFSALPPKPPTVRMEINEDANFLKLASSLRLLLARSVTAEAIQAGKELLIEYLMEYRKVR